MRGESNYGTGLMLGVVAGTKSESNWVFEQTGYSSRFITFSEDAYFYMDTTGFRIGAKYSVPLGGMRLWAGALIMTHGISPVKNCGG